MQMSSYLETDGTRRSAEALVWQGTHRIIVAGGTDFYPCARRGKSIDEDILDVTAIADLRRIEPRGTIISHRGDGDVDRPDPRRSAGLVPYAMKQAARAKSAGCRSRMPGTIVGNVCNASPAADGVPGLVALDASVVLGLGFRGTGSLHYSDFVAGQPENRAKA
jgi:CO/xanthine dehydrogenase FAD-binding subunit